MSLPDRPVTLSVQELRDLESKLRKMRHDINNQLTLITAAVELIRHKPDVTEKMLKTLAEQPGQISASITTFSAEFEKAVGMTRP